MQDRFSQALNLQTSFYFKNSCINKKNYYSDACDKTH